MELAETFQQLPLDDPYAAIFPEWNAWNRTEKARADIGTIHDHFHRAALRQTQKIAVRCATRQLTYAELHSRVAILSAYLREVGVGPGSIVGVALPRSIEAVIAMLAILKCGGAYTPLDPALPKTRLSFMAAEAQLQFVIVGGVTVSRGTFSSARLIFIDAAPLEPQTYADMPPAASPSDLAYVMFTSGSTGRPKGAMLPHAGVMNWMLWMCSAFEVTESDVILWKAIVGFDHSVWECFLPLIVGATLVIAEPGREADWDYLSDLIATEKVTIAQFVPSVLRGFVEYTSPQKCMSLRHVMSGGEALSPGLVHRFYEKIPDCQLCNAYGPTEASIGVTMFPCPRKLETNFVPIGRPIDNIKIHVLNGAMRPVKMGEVGELYIQGGLARGYVNHPELTAERFVKTPFGSQTLYKTGDLAEWLHDGNLRFIGRADNQIKIRGYRIELEEVESVLKQYPGIEEGVAAVAGESEFAALWCYFQEKTGSNLSKDAIRAFLESRLPSYMVPVKFIKVAGFPLIDSGKINRKALFELEDIDAKPIASVAVPLQNEFGTIIDIWRNVLNVSDVDPSADFYELGGNSLLLSILLIHLKKRLGMEMPADLDKLRTVSGTVNCLSLQRKIPH